MRKNQLKTEKKVKNTKKSAIFEDVIGPSVQFTYVTHNINLVV